MIINFLGEYRDRTLAGLYCAQHFAVHKYNIRESFLEGIKNIFNIDDKYLYGEYYEYDIDMFDDMVDITTEESVEKHGGREKVKEFYSNLDFAYRIGKCKAHIVNDDGTITLIYSRGEKYATNTKTRLVVKEYVGQKINYKIVLPDNLNDFLK